MRKSATRHRTRRQRHAQTKAWSSSGTEGDAQRERLWGTIFADEPMPGIAPADLTADGRGLGGGGSETGGRRGGADPAFLSLQGSGAPSRRATLGTIARTLEGLSGRDRGIDPRCTAGLCAKAA